MAAPQSTTTITKNDVGSTFATYTVRYLNQNIHTTVTCSPSIVTTWVTRVRANHHQSTNLIVGLDTESLKPIAILQLCVGNDCLIYQLRHARPIPLSLRNFLSNPTCEFFGVGVVSDVKWLARDYQLNVVNVLDVSRMAADMGMVRVNAGLKEVAKAVLGWEVEKCKEITMSNWNKKVLDDRQVMYACMDAFLSYQIAKKLNSLRIVDLP